MNTLGVDIVLEGEEEEGQSDQHCGLYVLTISWNSIILDPDPEFYPNLNLAPSRFTRLQYLSILKEEKTGMTS